MNIEAGARLGAQQDLRSIIESTHEHSSTSTSALVAGIRSRAMFKGNIFENQDLSNQRVLEAYRAYTSCAAEALKVDYKSFQKRAKDRNILNTVVIGSGFLLVAGTIVGGIIIANDEQTGSF